MKKALVVLMMLLLVAIVGYSPEASAQMTSFATGTVAGTGSAINVSLGFTPRSVIVSRVSATAANNYQAFHTSSMASGYMTLHGPSALTYVTTAGISPYAGTTAIAKGFTIGTNSSLNVAGDVLFWQAWR